jgi:hypothetical protein
MAQIIDSIADAFGDGRPSRRARRYCTKWRWGGLSEALERRILLSSSVYFHSQKTYTTGSDPQSVAVADLNGDFKQDIVVANFAEDNISVLLGNGDGTFRPEETYNTGLGPNGIVLADVNGDGFPDVIVADRNANNVDVLLNNGSGAFDAGQTFAVGSAPRSIAVGDFNGDGKLDLAVANNESNNVSILLGNGDGTFQPQMTFQAAQGATSIAVGDFDRDGKLDLVTVGLGQSDAIVLSGSGDGEFNTRGTVPLSAPGAGVAVADLTGDGRDDLVVAEGTADQVEVVPGIGDGTFDTGLTISTGANSDPAFIKLADMNGDGSKDIVVTTDNSTVEVLPILLDQGFLSGPSAFVSFPTGSYPSGLAIADVNGDGSPDLIVPNFGDQDVSVLLNDPPPAVVSIRRVPPTTLSTQSTTLSWTVNFTEPVSGLTPSDFSLLAEGITAGTPEISPASGPSATYTVTLPDFTGSGYVGLDYNPTTLPVNDMGEPLKLAMGFPNFTSNGTYADTIATGDFNRDGILDAVSAGANSDQVFVSLDAGAGDFYDFNSTVGYQACASGSYPLSIAVGDINDDGKLDVVTANSDGSISLLLGNGDGTLLPYQQIAGPSTDANSVALADYNRDGRLDVVYTGDNKLGFLEGSGGGTFQSPQTIAAGSGASHVVVADVNGDGWPDYIVSNGNDGTIDVFLSGLAPVLPILAPITVSAGGEPANVQVADINGDGKPDLIAELPDSNEISVMLGDGTGHFGSPILTATYGPVIQAGVGDLSGDGKLDLAVADGGQIDIFRGNGDGTFQDEYYVPNNATNIVVADVSRDGLADMIVGDGTSIGVDTNAISNYFSGDYWDLLKRDATLNVTGAKLAYDGNPHPAIITATGATGEDLTSLASVSYEDTANNTTSSVPPTAVGTYKVFASFAGNDSYNAIASYDTGKTVVISDHALSTATLSVAGAGDFVFDGSSHAATVTATGVNGEDLSSLASISYEDTATNTTSSTPPSQIGDYEIFASFAGNDDYYPIDPTDTGKAIIISAHALPSATLTVTGASAIYDGNPHAGSVVATGTNGEDLSSLASLTYLDTATNASSSSPPTQIGSYEIYASFSGNADYNSMPAFDTGKSVVISPASALTVAPSGKLPAASFVAGAKIKPIHLPLKVTNTSDAAESESISISAVFSVTSTGTPQDPVAQTITKTVKLKAHQTISFGSVTINSLPAGLTGAENLLLKLTDAAGGQNITPAGTVDIQPANIDLAALSTAPPTRAAIGKKFAAAITLIQNGNVPFSGNLPVELFLSADATLDSGDIDLGRASAHLTVQPKKKATAHLSATIPAGTAAGTYFLIAQIDPGNTLGDTNLTNNVIASSKEVVVS